MEAKWLGLWRQSHIVKVEFAANRTLRVTGEMFAEMIKTNFHELNAKTRNPNVKVFFQSGDPNHTNERTP